MKYRILECIKPSVDNMYPNEYVSSSPRERVVYEIEVI